MTLAALHVPLVAREAIWSLLGWGGAAGNKQVERTAARETSRQPHCLVTSAVAMQNLVCLRSNTTAVRS